MEDSSGNAFKSIGQLEFISRPADGARVVIEGITYEFDSDNTVTESATHKKVDITNTTSTAEAVQALLNKVIASDSDFDTLNNRIKLNPGNSAALLFTEDGTRDLAIDPRGLLTTSGTFATRQETQFTVRKTGAGYRDYEQFTYSAPPANNDTITINGKAYTFTDGETADDGDNSVARTTNFAGGSMGTLNFTTSGTISSSGTPFSNFQAGDIITFGATTNNDETYTITGVSADGRYITVDTGTNPPQSENAAAAATGTGVILHNILTDLEAAIESVDAQFAEGSPAIRTRTANRDATTAAVNSVNTLMISNLASPFTVQVNSPGHSGKISEPDDGPTYDDLDAKQFTIDKTNAVAFTSKGVPTAFNVTEVEILGFGNGAADMDDDPNRSKQMALDLGTIGKNNGLTQFGSEFEPRFIQTDGSQYGTFAGVTISTEGLVTARFSNGETRPIFRIPIANFVNVNALEARTGNVWNATEASGDPTLFEADSGPVGKTIQAALEQSTVDIGEEFTKMIVVQRAFSAAAKIISTSDEMLEELLRTKR